MKRFASFLMSVLLVLLMVPVSMTAPVRADAVPEETAATGVVQQPNDVVIFCKTVTETTGGGYEVNPTGMRVMRAARSIKNTVFPSGYPGYGRVIFVLEATAKWSATSHFGDLENGSNIQGMNIVYTTKVTVTDSNRVYKTSKTGGGDAGDITLDTANYPAGLYNHFDNADPTKNVMFDVIDTTPDTPDFMNIHCNVTFDFITFNFQNKNFLFYCDTYNVTFGRHVVNNTAGTGVDYYPIIINGRGPKGSDNDTDITVTNQTLTVLGGEWQYVSPRGRDKMRTYSGGTINLILGGTAIFRTGSVNGANSTVFVCGSNMTNLTVNVTIKDSVSLESAALFGPVIPGLSGNPAVTLSNITLNVTIQGRPTLKNGLLAQNTGGSTYAAPTDTTVTVTIAADALPTIPDGKKISGGRNTANQAGVVESTVSSYSPLYPEYTFDEYTTYTDLCSPIDYATTADSTGIKVYVDSNRSDYTGCSGVDADHPLPDLARAFRILKDRNTGGEILIVNTVYDQVSQYIMPKVGHPVTITSADENNQGFFVIYGSIRFYDDITFDNVAIARTDNVKAMIMNYNDLAINANCTNYTIKYVNGYAVKNKPVTPSFSEEGKLIIIAGAYANISSDVAIYGTNVEVDQTITINSGVYRSLRLGSKYAGKDDHYSTDESSGLTGANAIEVSIGPDAVVQSIDAESESDVTLTLSLAAIGRIKLNNAEDGFAAPVDGQLDIYTSQQDDLSWIVPLEDIEWDGFSLRDYNSGSRPFAIRGEFRQSKAALDNAVEIGVLIRNSLNTENALELSDSFNNRYGEDYDPADFNIVKGVGKSIVYLKDATDPNKKLYNGILVDSDQARLRGVLSYDSSDYSNKDTSYDFRAYASYALKKQNGEYTLYTVYSDPHTASLTSVATDIATNGTAADKAVAENCLAVIG